MGREGGDRAPLDGVRVLDFTQVIAGPYCTTLLADFGAEVVKIERPGVGDDLRRTLRHPGREDHEDFFHANNRSKKSICLDLKDPDHQEIGQRLAERADVVVENFAPGTADRLAMGWEDLRSCNPRLVYCSISGFGQTGPARGRLATDPIVQSVSGIMSVTGQPDGEPTQVGAPVGDVIAGLYGAYTIMGALRLVERDGKGRWIDISMQAAMLAALGTRMGETLQAGIVPGRLGNQNPMRVPANVYRTRDGVHLNMSVSNDGQWVALCEALERPQWLADERFAKGPDRVVYRDEIDTMVAERIKEKTADQWIPRLEALRIQFAPVKNYKEALEDPQVVHRRIIHSLDHPESGEIRVVGPPWIISDLSTSMTSPPVLGQHTGEVLSTWLGWRESEIARFLNDGDGRKN